MVAIIHHYSTSVDFQVKIWRHHSVEAEENKVEATVSNETCESDVFSAGYTVVSERDNFDGAPLENPEQSKDKKTSADHSHYNMSQKDYSTSSRWFREADTKPDCARFEAFREPVHK